MVLAPHVRARSRPRCEPAFRTAGRRPLGL